MFLAILLNEQFMHLTLILYTAFEYSAAYLYVNFGYFLVLFRLHFGMLELIFKKTIYMNMNYDFLTTLYESIFAQKYILLVEKYVLQFWLKNFHSKKETMVSNTRKTYSWAKILPYIVEG